ncbi:MAG: Dihydroxyacetone kinase family protein [Oscillospiraceae bacterium]|nr:Dihydroxyacetone kinase family protein [Oscillospiraceae bacterium]
MIATIDGTRFQRMVIHGAACINLRKQMINELNVFPVPDGDTGTNMSLTMGTAAAEMKKKTANTIAEASSINASALLRGARGNSGVILSLLFRGFAKAMKELDTADGAALAGALSEGVSAAYKAVMKPAEGTILTVSRLAANRAVEAAAEQNKVEFVLEEAIHAGENALADTINQNPVLKKAGVVDAGGKGFLVILQGMLDCLQGKPLPETPEETAAVREKADFGSFQTQDITFGYCTEFICSRDAQKDPELLRRFLNQLGDSLVLVDDDDIIKVHVHTNHPGKVLEEALTYGALLTIKIENMREQHTEILDEIKESAPSSGEETHRVAPAEKPIGVVAVCAGDGLAAIFRDLGADGVISGGQTMNPSTEDILREIENTPAETVFVLPNNKNIIMAAQQCISLSTEKKVLVLPTKTIPQGIAALLALEPEAGAEENFSAMESASAKVHTAEITYAARNSDFDGFTIREGDYMALLEHQLFGTDRDIDVLLNQLAQSETYRGADFINIFYGSDVTEAQAQSVQERFKAACPQAEITLLAGGQPVYYYMISAE